MLGDSYVTQRLVRVPHLATADAAHGMQPGQNIPDSLTAQEVSS